MKKSATLVYYILFMCCTALPSYAWTNHMVMTYAALKDVPGIKSDITVEPVERFLIKEVKKIGDALDAEESWARQSSSSYPPRPDALRFTVNAKKEIRVRFLDALRINPDMMFKLYLQPVDIDNKRPRAAWNSISRYPYDYIHRPLVMLKSGEKVSVLEVISTASNEPDDGYDMGLFENNTTTYGKIYGYGRQPFSDPSVFTYSQAPFHMGFYQESWIVYAAAPYLRKCFTEQRAHMYYTLSRIAFETGHPYWGYRFAGMGMHYVADLNFSFHAYSHPGISTVKMLWVSVLNIIGIHGPYQKSLAFVTNGHIFIETLVYSHLRPLFDAADFSSPLFSALTDRSGDAAVPAYSGRFVEDVVSKESADSADDLVSAMEGMITDKTMFDTTAELSRKNSFNPDSVIAGASQKQTDSFWNVITGTFRAQGGYLRAYLKSVQSM